MGFYVLTLTATCDMILLGYSGSSKSTQRSWQAQANFLLEGLCNIPKILDVLAMISVTRGWNILFYPDTESLHHWKRRYRSVVIRRRK